MDNFPEALKHLNAHLAAVATAEFKSPVPLDQFHGRGLRISYLRDTNNFVKMDQEADKLLKDINALVFGTTQNHAWIGIELLTSAVQQKNPALLKKRAEYLRKVISELPDFAYAERLIAPMEAAMAGTYNPAMLDPVRQTLGKNNSLVRRLEKSLAQTSTPKKQ